MCKDGEKMKNLKVSHGITVNGILEYANPCHLLWQRDVNAAKNMLGIANSIWDGQGRPDPFNRSIAVAETVTL